LARRSQTVLPRLVREEYKVSIETDIYVMYMMGGVRRSATLTLPIRHAENAYAWLKAHFPEVKVLDTRKSNVQ
jgi:hypothetical protein